MATKITTKSKDGILLVGASNERGDYILWQRSSDSTGPGDIQFDWDDQSNGLDGTVFECSVDRDGVHVVLYDKSLVHFYFSGLAKVDWVRFRGGLEDMYLGVPDVLDFHY